MRFRLHLDTKPPPEPPPPNPGPHPLTRPAWVAGFLLGLIGLVELLRFIVDLMV